MTNAASVSHRHPAGGLLLAPSRGWVSLQLRELWAYRELLYYFTWRTIQIRYKQTVLGAAWAVLQPLLTMVVFSVFFGKLANVPSDGVPYPIFSYAALVPWAFFAHGLQNSATSLVANGNMLKKIYFPRLILPASTVLSGAVDFVLAFSVLILMMFAYGFVPTVNIAWIPLFFLIAMLASLGVGLWLSAMNVQYRDVKHTAPFLVQIWMFATPIAYPSSLVEAPWKTLYALNPMVGVVEGFRWALLGIEATPGPMVMISSLAACTIFVSGLYYFRWLERTFADVV